ncbi:MAG: molybdopterin-dependent oxidoreductase [Microthrixaceae bacterium]
MARFAEGLPGVRFLSTLRRSNVHGAIDLGAAPGLLPGRVRRADAEEWFAARWDRVPSFDGGGARAILEAAASGRIDTLVLLGCDPLTDFVDRDLAERALIGARHVVAVDLFPSPSNARAEVVLAAAGFAEQGGTTTNLEGRVAVLGQMVTPTGTSRPDWTIADDIGRRLGADLGCGSLDRITREIAGYSVAHRGLDEATLASAGLEGVTVPLPDGPADESPADGVADGGGADEDDAAEAVVEQCPPMVCFDAPSPTPVPTVDAYSFRLVAERSMYDDGRQLSRVRSLSGLADAATLRMHPADLDRVALGAERVRVGAHGRTVVVEVRRDPTVAPRTVVMAVGHDNASPHQLIAAADTVCAVTVEAVR